MSESNKEQLERVFADLAYAALTDKASALVPYLLGFQLLKESDQGTKAVGLFGFEIDKSVYYAPVFFLNGEICGFDSIYSRDSDLFFPLDEDWINMLINRKAVRVGDRVNKEDVRRLTQRPGSLAWRSQFVGRDVPVKIAEAMATMRDVSDVPSLPEVLAQARLSSAFRSMLLKHAWLREQFTKYYDLFMLSDDVDVPTADTFEKTAQEHRKTLIISTINDDGVEALTDEQRSQVLAGEVAVIDRRDQTEISSVYQLETDVRVETVSGNGLYDIICSDGSLVKAIVCEEMSQLSRVSVYGVSAPYFGCALPSSCVYATKKYPDDEYRAALQEAMVRVDALRPGQTVFIVSVDGFTVGLFKIDQRVESARGSIVYKVSRPVEESVPNIADVAESLRDQSVDEPSLQYFGQDMLHGVRTFRRTNLFQSVDELIVRNSHFTRPSVFESSAAISVSGFFALPVKSRDLDRYRLTVNDLRPQLAVQALLERSTVPIEIWKDGREFVIRDAHRTLTVKKADAFRALMMQYGVSESDARHMLKSACERVPQTWFIKIAQRKQAQHELDTSLPFAAIDAATAANELNPYVPAQEPTTIVSSASSPDNRSVYEYTGIDESPLHRMRTALQLGQKEVFDAAVIESLMNTKFPIEMVERFIPVLMAGVDRLGRILFIIHWNYQNFADKYGEADLRSVIDDLRNTFQSLGATVYMLQQRRMSHDSDMFNLISTEVPSDTSVAL